MKKYITIIAAIIAVWGTDAFANAIDVIDANSVFANNFFIPDANNPADIYQPPWFRRSPDDWGWQHNPITDPSPITSATLTIRAWDIDTFFGTGEKDEIFAKDADTSTWVSLGILEGNDNEWENTTFNLPSSVFDEVVSGLEVWMDIDTLPYQDYQFGTTLQWSRLEVTFGEEPNNPPPPPPPPGDNPIPAPGALLLSSIGVGLVSWMRRRKFR